MAKIKEVAKLESRVKGNESEWGNTHDSGETNY